MVAPRVLNVVAIQTGVDMRVTRSFLEERICRRLKPGQCIIRVNMRQDMIRIFWGGEEPGMATAWAKTGYKWSRERIANWMRNGINVELKNIYDQAETFIEQAA